MKGRAVDVAVAEAAVTVPFAVTVLVAVVAEAVILVDVVFGGLD